MLFPPLIAPGTIQKMRESHGIDLGIGSEVAPTSPIGLLFQKHGGILAGSELGGYKPPYDHETSEMGGYKPPTTGPWNDYDHETSEMGGYDPPYGPGSIADVAPESTLGRLFRGIIAAREAGKETELFRPTPQSGGGYPSYQSIDDLMLQHKIMTGQTKIN